MPSVDHHYRAVFKFNEIWGHWFRENLSTRVPGSSLANGYYLVTTNSVGARSAREPVEVDDSTKTKVLFIGCSFTAGDGVCNQQRFSDLLEQKLGTVESHNFALSGSGNDQQLLIHEQFQPLIKPDILILSPFVGCLGRNMIGLRKAFDPLTGVTIFRPKPYFKLIDNDLRLANSPVPKRALHLSSTAGQEGTKVPTWFGTSADVSSLARLKRVIKRMIGKQSFNTAASYRDKNADIYKLGQAILTKTLLTSQATTKIVMPLPRFEDVFGSGSITYRDFYQEVADRTDSIFLDCIAAFKTSSKSELESFFFLMMGTSRLLDMSVLQTILQPIYRNSPEL